MLIFPYAGFRVKLSTMTQDALLDIMSAAHNIIAKLSTMTQDAMV